MLIKLQKQIVLFDVNVSVTDLLLFVKTLLFEPLKKECFTCADIVKSFKITIFIKKNILI